jgi:hypothetical protein
MLTLRFFVEIGKTTQLVISPARINDAGYYSDYKFIYTEAGKFLKAKVKGGVEEIFSEEDDEEETL